MRVFMLGWEFPPFISGGLGTACYGLTKAMSSIGTDIMFVLPRPVSTPFSTHVRLVSPREGSPLASPTTEFRLDEFEHVTFRTVNAALSPYTTPADYQSPAEVATKPKMASSDVAKSEGTAVAVKTVVARAVVAGGSGKESSSPYGGDMFAEIQRYALLATEIARSETIDVVHAHDWMTFPAGLAVAALKNVPLIVHVHSTEFLRSVQEDRQPSYGFALGLDANLCFVEPHDVHLVVPFCLRLQLGFAPK